MTFPDDLRIGDAERDAAMEALREHYAQGRLTHEELDERLDMVLSARTGRDLALAGAELPDLYGPHGAVADGGGEYGEQWEHHPWAHRSRGREWREAHRLRHAQRHGHPGWPPHAASWQNPATLQQFAAWQRAAARHHRGERRGGHPAVAVLFVMIVVTAITGFGALKFLFLAWLVMAVAGMFHHRRWHHHGHMRR
ncbi:DUF1707 domain-containing protein [Streptosporangium sp. NPDC051023]|uniref:DUF1707 SHOCT-like domain-containing protein n=1 Tax=Streptosporangium sp. NPDC051023 TaxID=3155410 RepID=UPI00344C44C5